MKQFLRLLSITAVFTALTQLVGCSTPMAAPSATIENTVKLRNVPLAPAAVGEFALAKGRPEAKDRSVGIRGTALVSPVGGSLSKYLGETLRKELQAAQLLDANSGTQISGFLVDSDVDAPMGTGIGYLTARFVVKKADSVAYDRELSTKLEWESSFMGAIAIPTAAQNYAFLYKRLVGTLFDDPDFRQALAK
jgi:hypothetical protein